MHKHSLSLPLCFLFPFNVLLQNVFYRNSYLKNTTFANSLILLFVHILHAWMYSLVMVFHLSGSLQLHTVVTKREGRLERRCLRWEAECIGRTLSNALESFSAKVSSGAVRRREGQRGADSTGGGVEGALGEMRDREGTAERWGTQTDMLRPRRG